MSLSKTPSDRAALALLGFTNPGNAISFREPAVTASRLASAIKSLQDERCRFASEIEDAVQALYMAHFVFRQDAGELAAHAEGNGEDCTSTLSEVGDEPPGGYSSYWTCPSDMYLRLRAEVSLWALLNAVDCVIERVVRASQEACEATGGKLWNDLHRIEKSTCQSCGTTSVTKFNKLARAVAKGFDKKENLYELVEWRRKFHHETHFWVWGERNVGDSHWNLIWSTSRDGAGGPKSDDALVIEYHDLLERYDHLEAFLKWWAEETGRQLDLLEAVQ